MANKGAQQQQQKPDDGLEEKVLFVNRCSKVVKGGRKFSFSALILVGDQNGSVGYGFAKANELTDAIRKGGEAARKNMVTFEMEGVTIPHEVLVDYDGARLLLKPAPDGTGVVAGSRVRSILEFAGLRDVVAKNLGSNNPINQVKATFKALLKLRNKKRRMELRGIS
ncbi:MAG: 30S ribosomal protein S5 [Chlamydiales bacterium]|nr:30S ribosomal protein S5 [Chlamydiales bacterium]